MLSFLNSSLGKKYVMAITGLMLIGFVIAHLAGNLQVFIGREAINNYGQSLKDLGGLLWVARIGLIVVFILHMVTALQLKMQNKQARPVAYQSPGTMVATLSSRTMALSGMAIFAYLVYHLAHFTLHKTNPEFAGMIDTQGRHDVYQMVITGFSNVPVTITYVIAMFLLAAHLWHGASSVFQSLGLNSGKYRAYTRLVGPLLATVVFIGYVSIPVAVYLEFLR